MDQTRRSPDDLLTTGEVARMFRVDSKTAGRWAASGRLPSIRTPGGHRRFRWGDIAPHLEPIGKEGHV